MEFSKKLFSFIYKWKYKKLFNKPHNVYNCITKLSFSSEKSNANLKILFFGTDKFSIPSLRILSEEKETQNYINQLDVVTSFKSNLNEVKKFSEQHTIKCFDWQTSNQIDYKQYDIGIVVSFGYLIPESVITSFPLGMINVHASLLPRWRGAAPIIYSILNGDKMTGVTIMKIRPKKFDIGEIVNQKSIEIPKNILMPELHKILANEGALLLINSLKNLPECLDKAVPQSNANISYAPKVTRSLTELNWNEMSSQQIFNLYRALYSYKSVITNFNGSLVKITELSQSDELPVDSIEINLSTIEKTSGYIKFIKKLNLLRVTCCDNQFIYIRRLAIEGKPIMLAVDFNNGFLMKLPSDKRFFTNINAKP